MTTLTIIRPITVSAPRGAWLAAAAFARLLQIFQTSHDARAQRRAQMERETDVARLRRFATQMMEVDPRFASDLFAAADRHDQGL